LIASKKLTPLESLTLLLK